MVKKSMFRVLFAAAALSVASCATNGDIDDLKDQLTELEGQVGGLEGELAELEEQQQQALLAQISKLEADIATLQGELDGTQSDIAADYDALLGSLTDLQEEVASGAKVHYGAVLTDADFDAFLASEATITTGDVVITSAEQLAKLDKLALVGGDLLIKDGGDVVLNNLESVSGNVNVAGAATSISLPMLKAIGKELHIVANENIVSANLPEVILINGDFILNTTPLFTTINLAKLDVIGGNLMIDNYNGDNKDEDGAGSLSDVDFSYTDVIGNVDIINTGSNVITLGTVGGSIAFSTNKTLEFDYSGTTIGGDLTIDGNSGLSYLNFGNLKTLNGNLTIDSNNGSSGGGIGISGGIGIPGGGGSTGGLSDLSGFDTLEYIGGNVLVNGNKGFTTLEGFNNVHTVYGGDNAYSNATIRFNSNGNEKVLMNVFNKLTTTKEVRFLNISITEKTEWFDGFNSLVEAANIELILQRTQDSNYNTGIELRIDGFDALTEFQGGSYFDLAYATEVSVLPVCDSVSSPWNSYVTIAVPEDTSVSMCSLKTLATAMSDGSITTNPNSSPFIGTYGGAEFSPEEFMDMYMIDCQ